MLANVGLHPETFCGHCSRNASLPTSHPSQRQVTQMSARTQAEPEVRSTISPNSGGGPLRDGHRLARMVDDNLAGCHRGAGLVQVARAALLALLPVQGVVLHYAQGPAHSHIVTINVVVNIVGVVVIDVSKLYDLLVGHLSGVSHHSATPGGPVDLTKSPGTCRHRGILGRPVPSRPSFANTGQQLVEVAATLALLRKFQPSSSHTRSQLPTIQRSAQAGPTLANVAPTWHFVGKFDDANLFEDAFAPILLVPACSGDLQFLS